MTVTAPSRLHFGLFALAAAPSAGEAALDPGRSFGGVGVMVANPCITLRIRAAKGFQVAGELSERTRSFARQWAEFYSHSLDNIELTVVHAPPDHVGLGTGTQLGLAIAAGLAAFHGLPVPPAEELARSVGRGIRSAIGAYGFTLGGLIVERGKLSREFLSPLDCRLELPTSWRFVLVRPTNGTGLAGEPEQLAMDHANRDLTPLTNRLVTEARERLIPAAASHNFAEFAASLGRYCELAGQFYTEVQGGPYNGPVVTALAAKIRALGHVGLGQSSWGPTLFVACANETAAQALATQLLADSAASLQVTITPVCNESARIEMR